MSILTAVGQIGQKSDEIKAAKLAEKDLKRWGKLIARTALEGSTSYSNFHSTYQNPFSELFHWFIWLGRNTPEYAEALQRLMPTGFNLKVKYCGGYDGDRWIRVSWENTPQ